MDPRADRRGRREREFAATLGQVGVWNAALAAAPAARVRRAAAELEQLGYGALWLPEGSKDVFVNSAVALAASERLVVTTAIASPWIRDPYAMSTAARTLGEAFPGRFALGVGISHEGNERFGGERYERPLTQMREYLDAMDDASYYGPIPSKPVQRVLAALGPKMLALAAERTRGAHTYLVPVEHTAFAREVLGPEPVLAVEQSFVLGRSRLESLEIARRHLARYLDLPNYRNNLLRAGFARRDLAGGGSDRLVEAVVAIGSPAQVAERVHAHLDGGADHVCVQPLGRDYIRVPLRPLAKVAAALELR